MFEIVMGIDDFSIQLVKYCIWLCTLLIITRVLVVVYLWFKETCFPIKKELSFFYFITSIVLLYAFVILLMSVVTLSMSVVKCLYAIVVWLYAVVTLL